MNVCPRILSPSLEVISSARKMAVPTVGWPAKGTSWRGVKIRTLAVPASVSGGPINTVSERFISSAMRCISSDGRCVAFGNTARGLPPNVRLVNTSSV